MDIAHGTIVTSQMSAFAISNSDSFKHFRLAVTAGTGSYVVIGEMALVGVSALATLDTIPIAVTPVNDPPTLVDAPLPGGSGGIVSVGGDLLVTHTFVSDGIFVATRPVAVEVVAVGGGGGGSAETG